MKKVTTTTPTAADARAAYEQGCVAFVESLFNWDDPQNTINLVTDAFMVCAIRQDSEIVNIDSGHCFIMQLRGLVPLYKYYDSL